MPDVDIRAVWLIGRAVFRYWFLGAGMLLKPAVLLWRARLPWARAIFTGIAMSLSGFLFIVVFPVGAILSLILFEVLLKPVVRIDQFGAITWILPAVISAAIGTLLDVLVFFLCFRRKISRALLFALLLVNAFSLALAAYRLVAYVDAHPPEA